MLLSVSQQVFFDAFARAMRDEYYPDEYPAALGELLIMLDTTDPESDAWIADLISRLQERLECSQWYRPEGLDLRYLKKIA
jgi:hypothetical protein